MSKVPIIIMLLLLLTGCSVAGADTETIMRPPKATGEQAGIQAALEKTASGNVTFKYPQTGQYRSAIIMYDIDGDDVKEAIAFFRPETEGAGAHMCVLDKREQEWVVLSNITGPGADIDRVMFGDFDRDGIDEIVVGWSTLTTRDKSCSIYRLEHGVITELMANEFYTEMAVFDIDQDKRVELLTVFSSDQSSVAKLLVMSDSTMKRVSDVRLDSAITSYVNVQTTYLDRETPAMVLDGYVSTGILATEILYWNKEREQLIAPFNAPDGNVTYSREVSFHPTDINNDGYVDFPRQIPLPGSDMLYQELSEGVQFPPLIEWSTFHKLDDSFTVISQTVIGPAEDVWFNLDAMDLEQVEAESGLLSIDDFTALQNNKERKITYYLYNRYLTMLDNPLFDIQVFGQYTWEQQDPASFIVLEKQSGLVYTIRFYDNKKLTDEIRSMIINAIDIRPAQ